MSITMDAIKTFFNTRQKDTEFLQEYTRRYKSARDIMESHISGPIKVIKIDWIIKRMQGFNA